MKYKAFIGALFLWASMSGCTTQLLEFTVISTRNMPLGEQAALVRKADQEVKGVDKSHIVLFFPFGRATVKGAMEKAMDKYPGTIGLADGEIKTRSWWAYLYGQSSIIVEGTPLYVAGVEKSQREIMPLSDNVVLMVHEVKEGETLETIAAFYKVSVADIMEWNDLASGDVVSGTKLRVLVKDVPANP